MKRLALVLVLFATAACATNASYAPAERAGGPGFASTRIEDTRYRVTFNGAPNAEAASDFVLLRAAEITLENGYDWFVVDQRFLDGRAAPSGPRFSVGLGVGSFGGNTSVGVGVGTGIPLGSRSQPTDASLEIRLGRGERPTNADAYDARSVVSSIGARVR
jgi:hypothetical protein